MSNFIKALLIGTVIGTIIITIAPLLVALSFIVYLFS